MRNPTLLALAALLSAPLPSHAADDAPRCRYVKIVELPIRYVGASLAPAVDATINDTPATMLVDTGSYSTALTMTAVTRRDLVLHATGERAVGIGGATWVYATHVKEIGVGPVKRTRRSELAVFGETSFTPEYDGILGAPFLLQMDLMLDLRAKRLKLYQPKDCDQADLLLWEENTVIVPTEGHTDENPNPHFKVLVNGKKLDAEIDSGAHRSFLSLDAAERLGIDVKNDPHVVRMPDSGGIGGDRAPHWVAPIQSVQIGDETIRNVELGVVDAQGRLPADLFLGQDFLRAHRVLFAMRQDKLYLAYLGGDVFTRGVGVEPWMRQEADAGNADARYALAVAYNVGYGVPRDTMQGRIWMELAASQGQPHASLLVARRQMLNGQVAEAIPKLRAALDQLPSDRVGPLWLYIARVRNGEAELGRAELEATVKKQQAEDWPYPIAQFYLGKWDAARLLAEAGKDKRFANNRTCQAETFIAEWQGAHGDKDQAKASLDNMRAHCDAPGNAPKVAQPGEPNK